MYIYIYIYSLSLYICVYIYIYTYIHTHIIINQNVTVTDGRKSLQPARSHSIHKQRGCSAALTWHIFARRAMWRVCSAFAHATIACPPAHQKGSMPSSLHVLPIRSALAPVFSDPMHCSWWAPQA